MQEKKIRLEDIHDCKKCHGKIVAITVNHAGLTCCGYCGQVVNYKPYIYQKLRKAYECECCGSNKYPEHNNNCWMGAKGWKLKNTKEKR